MTQELNAATDDASDQAVPVAAVELAPVAESQRIDVLDVLRGFALIGILMMNIEWFNRSIAVLTAPDLGLRDFDHAAGFLVKVFVEGKFYKLFSLLFGMGFAVMLLRAEEAGRPFIAWFARRAGVLLLIGLAHSVFLWTGDILHDYAIGAFLLLAVVWLRRGGVASAKLPVSIIAIAGSVHALVAMDNHVLIGYAVLAAVVAFALWLRGKDRWRFLRNPQWLLRIAIGMSLFPILMMSAAGIVEGVRRDPVDMQERFDKSEAKRAELTKAWPKREAEAMVEARKIAPGDFGDLDDGEDDKAEKADKAKKTEKGDKVEKQAKAKAEKDDEDKLPAENWFARRENRVKAEFWEQQAMTSKSYWVATKFRAGETLNGMGGAPFFALFLLLPIFMLGWWLVETGKMRNPEQHLLLFRTMAWVGWPFGLAFAMTSSILLYHPAWIEARGPDMVTGLLGWCGQVLLCAAYVASFVLLLRKRLFKRMLGWLAPLGRMALTNYLTHSLVFSTLFYGYGAGWFGHVPRFQQMGLVAAMIISQAIFSRIWLAYFNYGPMEWLWRSATYLKWQPLRRAAT
ncbi:MAG: DUF418 domain-containing protein [Xanthomonadales bacterium]|nr:DUF418 domain-containing protein [Xanthomonadales bacterium]